MNTANSQPRTNQYRISFVVEQVLGHVTHAQNLRGILEREEDIEARWILPEFQSTGLARKIPLYRSNWSVQSGLQARTGLSRLQREFPFEAIFFHTQVPAVLAQDWVKRFPTVVSLDATPIQYDTLGDAYDHHLGPAWLESLKFDLNRRCFLSARRLVTWSQWAKDGLISGYGVPGEKISVLPPGINLSNWRKPEKSRSDPGTVKILFVGGNLERKGGQELIQAFQRLQAAKPDRLPYLELHLVTKDPVPQSRNICIHQGLQPNSEALKQLYFDADIFCLPTRGDCLPMAIAEAGAAGLPIISTRIAGIPEMVLDGLNGFLIQPRDTAGLTSALERLVCDEALRREMGSRSKALILQKHDAEQNARALAKILREIIDESKTKAIRQ